MWGYIDLFIVSYLPWLIVDILKDHVGVKWAVLVSFLFIAKATYSSLKDKNLVNLIFVSGFLAYSVNLFFTKKIFEYYSYNILLFVVVFVVFSILRNKPFTITYAKYTVSADKWHNPIFIRINKLISSVWAILFSIEYVVKIFNPDYFFLANIAVVIVGLYFSKYFPDYYLSRFVTNKRNN